MNFASAQYYGGYSFCGASLSCWLDIIDPSWVILGGILIISFGLISFALSRSPLGGKNSLTGKPEATAISNIIALVISFFIIYGINKSGFDYENFWYGFFFFLPETFWDFIAAFLPLAFIILAIFLSFKYGFRKGIGLALMGLGGVFIIGSFVAYEDFITSAIGLIFLVVGFAMWSKK